MNAHINGIPIHYHDVGEGEPLLFVHGFPLDGQLWAHQVAALADEYRCIVPDLRGHGQSGASERASMAQYAADLAALLDEIGEARPVVLVGLSMGGYIAFEFLRRYPERVRALVLANTRAAADNEEGRANRYATIEKVRAQGSAIVAASMVPKLFAEDADEGLKVQWHEIMLGTDPRGVIAALEAMAQRPDSRPMLADIPIPTLVIGGAQDTITPPADAEAMAAAIPSAQLVIIPDAAHMTPVEQPDAFTGALSTFLDDLSAEDETR